MVKADEERVVQSVCPTSKMHHLNHGPCNTCVRILAYGKAQRQEGANAVMGALSDGQTEKLHRALGTEELRTVARDFVDYCDMMLHGANCPGCGGHNDEGKHDEGTLCDELKKAVETTERTIR